MARWGIGTSERAWAHSFREGSWVEIREFLGGMAAAHPEFGYLVDVVDSVIDSGADQLLAGATSMHDLMVVPRPVGDPVRDMIVVRAPGSLRGADAGLVRVEHLSSTGLNDSIDRPPSEAVRLLWRFLAEKYDVTPPKTGKA